MKSKVKEQVIDSKRLFYFSEVFKRGSLNAVAEHLDMAQAGIGRQIQLLEDELGMRLFERGTRGRGMVPGGHGKGMLPTEAAHYVHKLYCTFQDESEKLKVALEEMRQMKRGEISIVTPLMYLDILMEEVLNDFCAKHPHLNVHLEEINLSRQVAAKIADDTAHIGIVRYSPVDPALRCCARSPLPVNLLVTKDHPLACKPSVHLAEVGRYPIALPPLHSHARQIIQSVERSEKICLSPIFVGSVSARKNFVLAHHAVTFMSRLAAYPEIKAGQLIALQVDHPSFKFATSSLIVRRGRLLSPAAQQLLRLLTARFPYFASQDKVATRA
jgi:DNA-binding transcriptional LysR family regulator